MAPTAPSMVESRTSPMGPGCVKTLFLPQKLYATEVRVDTTV